MSKFLIRQYISKHKDSQARYDIDAHLLNLGYDPSDSDDIWQDIIAESNQKRLKNRISTTFHFVGINLMLVGLLIILLYLWPLASDVNVILFSSLLLFTLSFVELVIWNFFRKKFHYPLLVLNFYILAIAIPLFALGIHTANYNASNFKGAELDRTLFRGEEYRLFYDSTAQSLTIHRCGNFIRECPTIYNHKLRDSNPRFSGTTRFTISDEQIRVDLGKQNGVTEQIGSYGGTVWYYRIKYH